jgi:RimJ/RimL family protein N-acetyltransferase
MAARRPTLTTRRLTLRPWQAEDAADVFAYSNDREFSRFIPMPYPYTVHDAEAFVAACLKAGWDEHPRFAIVFDGHVVGDVNLRVDATNVTAGMGYGLARHCWRKGLATEAAAAVVGWAFQTHRLVKIWATADAENIASWRVMEKLGMQREGYFRSHRVIRGERRDVVQYGILREEWGPAVGSWRLAT